MTDLTMARAGRRALIIGAVAAAAVGVLVVSAQASSWSSYLNATFTNCCNSGATSTGNWDDHGSGDYYFVVGYGSDV
ncbi:hypothetical protein [Streptomyces eurythermus]